MIFTTQEIPARDVQVGDYIVAAHSPAAYKAQSTLEVWEVMDVIANHSPAVIRFATRKRCAYGDGTLSHGTWAPYFTGRFATLTVVRCGGES